MFIIPTQMEWLIGVSIFCGMGGLYFVLRLIQSQFEGFQKNMLLSQSEFQKNYQVASRDLKTDLAGEMLATRKELQGGLSGSTQALESRFQAINTRLETQLQGLSVSVQNNLTANLKQGFEQFEKVQGHLLQAELQLKSLSAVGQSINDLNNLLKLPHLRGGFGEMALERILSDLLPRDGYELQYRVVPGSTERVDAVIKYPNQVLPIDSKFPREQVLPLFETNDPAILEEARHTLSEVIRKQAKAIREKYVKPEHGTTDMALLFVPSETLYFEILRNLRLFEELGRLKIFTVSPNTLAVTLHAVSVSRSYYEMAKGVEKTVADLRKARMHFENFEKRFDEIGTQLGRATSSFQMAETHLSRYSSATLRLTGEEAIAEDVTPAPPPELPSGNN